ncbi:PID-CTERM protein-sorting domain-containing protein [Hymenobacter daeguensis]
MKSFFLTRLLPAMALAIAFGGVALAQPGSGGPGPGIPDPTAVPLDGGASLLLASGVAYGIKHLRNRRKKA